MADLSAADAENDAQHFQTSGPLRQHWVQAGATLLNSRKVEASGVGDGLCEVGDVVRLRGIGLHIRVASGNRRMLSHGNTWDGLRERVAEIWIPGTATIARKPSSVDRELHQVGEPPDLLRSGV